jgi:hypothetical protein
MVASEIGFSIIWDTENVPGSFFDYEFLLQSYKVIPLCLGFRFKVRDQSALHQTLIEFNSHRLLNCLIFVSMAMYLSRYRIIEAAQLFVLLFA